MTAAALLALLASGCARPDPACAPAFAAFERQWPGMTAGPGMMLTGPGQALAADASGFAQQSVAGLPPADRASCYDLLMRSRGFADFPPYPG
ncbi:hypothetical protein [Falsiroseomonas sp. HW251]|uniref:hypothetical protein n=1 Tax=Falsiroseomonas sp. HW251 TaxID=3390998 RepID=UPI003D310882